MTLIRFVQRASILVRMTLASLPFHSNPAQAEITEFCIIAGNGKTVCGKSRGIERMCITTNGSNTICGKFKSAKEGQEEARTPAPSSGYRKESDGVTVLLRSCRRSRSDIKCNLVINTKRESQRVLLRSGQGFSSIVDSAGKTYPSSTLDYSGSNSTVFDSTLSSCVDYVVGLNFENVPGQINQAALVNLIGGYNVMQFRNIPIAN